MVNVCLPDISQTGSGNQVKEWTAGSPSPGDSGSHILFSGHDVSTPAAPQQPLIAEQKTIDVLPPPSGLHLGIASCMIDSGRGTNDKRSVASVYCGSPETSPESIRPGFWQTLSGCFRCVRSMPENGEAGAGFNDVNAGQPGVGSASSDLDARLDMGFADSTPATNQGAITGERRFRELKRHLRLYPIDVEKFQHLSSSALSGEQGIIKFLDCKGSLEAIHNIQDPNIPEWHMETINGSNEFLRKELPPYYWFEFSITDSRAQKLDLVTLFNIGDADCNDGIWGEVFMGAGKIKIADIQSTGDMSSEIYLTNDAPEFASFDRTIVSNKLGDKDFYFIDFSETTEQLSRLISVAILAFYASLSFYSSEGILREATPRSFCRRYCCCLG